MNHESESRPRADETLPGPNIERIISRLLRTGMVSSFLLIVAGSLRSFFSGETGSTAAATHPALSPSAAPPQHFPDLLAGRARGDGHALILAGILTLIATPVLRVLVSAGVFVALRDRAYVVICTVVFALLVLSFFLGRAG